MPDMFVWHGTWYRCRVVAIRTGATAVKTKLNTGLSVSLKKNCAHVKFSPVGGIADDDDVVQFDVAKYGKARVFKKPAFAWVRRMAEIPQHAGEKRPRAD